jgi:hypothetical protein
LSFDLMMDMLATRTIKRSKIEIMLFCVLISWSKCQPPDQYYWTNLIYWKIAISILWNSTSWPWVKKTIKLFFSFLKKKFEWWTQQVNYKELSFGKIIGWIYLHAFQFQISLEYFEKYLQFTVFAKPFCMSKDSKLVTVID